MASIRKRSSVILLLAGLLGLTGCSSQSPTPGPLTQAPPATQPAASQVPPAFQSGPAQAAPAAAASPAASGGVIQTQETNTQGLVAELTECKRKDGVLTVKLHIRNTSGGMVTFYTSRLDDYDKTYVTADNKKYFILTDTEKQPLSGKTSGNESLNPGQTFNWWAKFPAPPAAVKSINLLTSVASPFDDVPIND